MLNHLPGLGALQDSLAVTNKLLAEVLAELKETNSHRLASIDAQLVELNAALEGLTAEQPTP